MEPGSSPNVEPGSAPAAEPGAGSPQYYNPVALEAQEQLAASQAQAQPQVQPQPTADPAAPASVSPEAQAQPGAAPAVPPVTPPAPGSVNEPARPSAMPAQAPKEKGKGWIVGLAAVIVAGAVCLFGIQSCNSSLGSLSLPGAGGTAPAKAAAESVGVIELSGEIAYDNSSCSPEGLKRLLDRAADDKNVKAVVLRVNSGGGTATAGEEMTAYLKEFKEKTGKPVVVSSASVNASAAYEISSQADYIFAAKSSAVGAIGTIMQTVSYAELLDKLGVKVDNITSSKGKDSSYGTRELTKDERAQYQHQVDQITDNFVEAVAEGRGMSKKKVRELANGMTYTGLDCVENGLVDAIGTRQDAVQKAADLAGMKGCETVKLEETTEDWSDLVGLLGKTNMSAADLVAALEELSNEKAIQ